MADRERKRCYSLTEAGEYLGLSPRTIRDFVDRGKLPAVRGCTRILIDIEDLDLWVTDNKTTAKV